MNQHQVKTEFKYVGTRPIRPDGPDKVTGRAKYGADLNLPGMLFGHIVRSPHAHARIKSIDFSAALKLPGVVATMSAEDLPEPGDRILPGAEIEMKLKDISPIIMARDKVLFHGQAVAAVDEVTAADAVEHAKSHGDAAVEPRHVLVALLEALGGRRPAELDAEFVARQA